MPRFSSCTRSSVQLPPRAAVGPAVWAWPVKRKVAGWRLHEPRASCIATVAPAAHRLDLSATELTTANAALCLGLPRAAWELAAGTWVVDGVVGVVVVSVSEFLWIKGWSPGCLRLLLDFLPVCDGSSVEFKPGE